jgi:thiamine pyrophosphokinase
MAFVFIVRLQLRKCNVAELVSRTIRRMPDSKECPWTKIMSQKIIIISGGRLGYPVFYQKRIAALKNYFVLCCDDGIRHLAKLNIKPDIIIGDMDSATADQLESYKACGVKILKYPPDKDDTDTQLALEYALELKPEAIEIWGALGGRIDHSLANLFLLGLKKEGIKIRLVDEYCEAFIAGKEAAFNESIGQTVSLIALGPQVTGISLAGFQYSLDNAILEMEKPLGISNVVSAARATISVGSGNLLIIRYWQKDIFPEAI